MAVDLGGGGILALTGNLGSGKTTFVQGLAEGLGIKSRIISPTFILMRKYDKNFYHIDLYRLEEKVEQEVKNLGLEDIWTNPQNLVVIEWAEKIKNIIPKTAIWIKFENLGGDKRRIMTL
jgi:tRNA threonylcarbamoyladenosine biosynthesis protein TsaE